VKGRSQESEIRSQKGKQEAPSSDLLLRLLRTVASRLGLKLSDRQMQQLATHFALLLQWNEKINLTAVRAPEEIAARHFGESLYLAKLMPPPAGLLVDVGSGAGFPGLPLKIAWPGVETVLLEPNQKKATFLKEVVRSCDLRGVEVRAERLEDAASLGGRAQLATMRAVALDEGTLRELSRLLASDGCLALYLGEDSATALANFKGFDWQAAARIPGAERRVIRIGRGAR
jgi:16S rRNA (guanine527-N7)-methyltransferase